MFYRTTSATTTTTLLSSYTHAHKYTQHTYYYIAPSHIKFVSLYFYQTNLGQHSPCIYVLQKIIIIIIHTQCIIYIITDANDSFDYYHKVLMCFTARASNNTRHEKSVQCSSILIKFKVRYVIIYNVCVCMCNVYS